MLLIIVNLTKYLIKKLKLWRWNYVDIKLFENQVIVIKINSKNNGSNKNI